MRLQNEGLCTFCMEIGIKLHDITFYIEVKLVARQYAIFQERLYLLQFVYSVFVVYIVYRLVILVFMANCRTQRFSQRLGAKISPRDSHMPRYAAHVTICSKKKKGNRLFKSYNLATHNQHRQPPLFPGK